MKTRTKLAGKGATKGSKETATSAVTIKSLEQGDDSPPFLFVLPKGTTNDARMISIPHPNGSSKPLRLLVCPQKGIFEFTNIAKEKGCRSWLLAPPHGQANTSPDSDNAATTTTQGHVLRRPDLLIATPLDAFFLMLPLMINGRDQQSYLSCSDFIFDTESNGYLELQQVLRQPAFASLLQSIEQRLATISDSINMGDDDSMYKLSTKKLCKVLLSKATRIAITGLPVSLEERFVKQVANLLVTHIADTSEVKASQTQPELEVRPEAVPQDTASSSMNLESSSIAAAPDPAHSNVADTASTSVLHLIRIRTAWDYMLRAYVRPLMHDELTQMMQQQSELDWQPLALFEKRINDIKQQTQALRSLSDNISRKRPLNDDEAIAKANEKRQKKEEEEQRKRSMSQGVKKLLKADTSNMKKLSSFFTKKPAK